jgi:D-sedoheptulose 7-phosphate isomerase
MADPHAYVINDRALNDLDMLMQTRFEHSVSVPLEFFSTAADQISRACLDMARRFHQGGRLFAFGCGSFATDAQHVAVEFVHPVNMGKRALPAIALTNDNAFLSRRIDNEQDVAFDHQISLLARPQDIALAFSINGEEPNLVKALRNAKASGLLTLAMTGSDGGELFGTEIDFCFRVPSQDPMLIQETHEMLYHVLWELVHVYFEHEGLLT